MAKFSLNTARLGTTKTCVTNFEEVCGIIKRDPEHFMLYISTELGALTNLGPENQLILKGRFFPQVMERLFKKYLINYV